MDRLHQIKAFVAVADALSFAGAARRLGLSPPAVTRAVNELEAHLAVRLLTRTTRVVRLTEAGRRYAEDCKRILADWAEADESVSGLHGTPQGSLIVTAPALFGARHVTPVVTQYLDRYPQVQVACWFLDRVVNLVEEGVDVAVRIGELPDSSLQAVRVGQVRRVVVGAPSYLTARGRPERPEDLARHTLVAASGVSPQPQWRFERDGEVQTVALQPRLTTTSNDAALSAAVGGFGLTRLLSYQVQDAVTQGRLEPVLTAFEPPPLPVHVVHREGRHASLKARAFIDLAVSLLREDPALR
ncbi:LysR family transcriptional regulator [Inhella crocodyli]|uniref:LysR family transcriptional regulator n=1 Tax=Inhella crocodyli TaxID=2499851 RepID=A0A3S2WPJ1_9BURK|nr:LysR family transcriptional regulator [Inhella crocodyli]RVT84762.1 LysR family transcriptional regulator [Inhella crocodyli]